MMTSFQHFIKVYFLQNPMRILPQKNIFVKLISQIIENLNSIWLKTTISTLGSVMTRILLPGWQHHSDIWSRIFYQLIGSLAPIVVKLFSKNNTRGTSTDGDNSLTFGWELTWILGYMGLDQFLGQTDPFLCHFKLIPGHTNPDMWHVHWDPEPVWFIVKS